MDEAKRNTLIGAFMVFGLAAFGWLMTSFGELPAWLGAGEYELIILVDEPSGISEGTPINLSGVQIGRVKELRFKDPAHLDVGVEIVGAISKEYVIPRTASAIVQPAGLGLGRGFINLTVIKGEQAAPLPEGEAIVGVMGNVWGDMIPDTLLDSVDRSVAQFGNFVEALTPVADDLHDLLEKHTVADVDAVGEFRRVTANIFTVVQRFDQTLKNFNETFGAPEIKEGWLEVFGNIKQMSIDGRESLDHMREMTTALREDLKRISDKFEGGIDNATEHLDEIALSLRPALENAAQLTALLVRIAAAIEAGEGTAGRFVRDARLYESLLLTSQRLTDLVDTIQRITAKFERDGAIHLKIPSALGRVPRDVKIPD